MNKDEITNELAKCMREKLNEVDYDPMQPMWDYLEDPLKDSFLSAARQAYESTTQKPKG